MLIEFDFPADRSSSLLNPPFLLLYSGDLSHLPWEEWVFIQQTVANHLLPVAGTREPARDKRQASRSNGVYSDWKGTLSNIHIWNCKCAEFQERKVQGGEAFSENE